MELVSTVCYLHVSIHLLIQGGQKIAPYGIENVLEIVCTQVFMKVAQIGVQIIHQCVHGHSVISQSC